MPVTKLVTFNPPSLQAASYHVLQQSYRANPSQLGNDLFSKVLPLGLANEFIQDILGIYQNRANGLNTANVKDQQQYLSTIKIQADDAFKKICQNYVSSWRWDFSPKDTTGLTPEQIREMTKANKEQYHHLKEASEEAEKNIVQSYKTFRWELSQQQRYLAKVIEIFNAEQLISLALLANSSGSHQMIAQNLLEQFKQLRHEQQNFEKLYQKQSDTYRHYTEVLPKIKIKVHDWP